MQVKVTINEETIQILLNLLSNLESDLDQNVRRAKALAKMGTVFFVLNIPTEMFPEK